MPFLWEFAGTSRGNLLPDESTILQFRQLVEHRKLVEQILLGVNNLLCGKGVLPKAGKVVDATLIAVQSSTKNKDSRRDSQMHQSKKGNEWFFEYVGSHRRRHRL